MIWDRIIYAFFENVLKINECYTFFSGQNDCNYPPTPYSTQSSRAERLNSNEPSPPPEEIRSSSLPTSSAPNADYGALLDKIVHLEVRFSVNFSKNFDQ